MIPLKSIIACLVFLVIPLLPAEWPCQGGNPSRTNYIEDSGIDPANPSFKLIWRAQLQGTMQNQPVVGNGMVFVKLFRKHVIEAVDLQTGEKAWSSFDTANTPTYSSFGAGYVYASPICYYQKALYYHSLIKRETDQTYTYVLIKRRADTGSREWVVDIGKNKFTRYGPVGYNGKIYGASQISGLMTFWGTDTLDGSMDYIFTSPSTSESNFGPAVDTVQDELYYSVDSGFYKFDLTLGTPIWKKSFCKWGDKALAFHNDTLYAVSANTPGKPETGGVLLLNSDGDSIGDYGGFIDWRWQAIHPDKNITAFPQYGSRNMVYSKQGILQGTTSKMTQTGCGGLVMTSGSSPAHPSGFIFRNGGGLGGSGCSSTKKDYGWIFAASIDETINNTGNEIVWAFQLPTYNCSSPIVVDGRFITMGGGGWLYCFGNGE